MRLPTVFASLALILPSVLIVQSQRVVGYYGKVQKQKPSFHSLGVLSNSQVILRDGHRDQLLWG